jgi:hypothetical protein
MHRLGGAGDGITAQVDAVGHSLTVALRSVGEGLHRGNLRVLQRERHHGEPPRGLRDQIEHLTTSDGLVHGLALRHSNTSFPSFLGVGRKFPEATPDRSFEPCFIAQRIAVGNASRCINRQTLKWRHLIGVDPSQQNQAAPSEGVPLRNLFMIEANGPGIHEQDITRNRVVASTKFGSLFIDFNKPQIGTEDLVSGVHFLVQNLDSCHPGGSSQTFDHRISGLDFGFHPLFEHGYLGPHGPLPAQNSVPDRRRDNSAENDRQQEYSHQRAESWCGRYAHDIPIGIPREKSPSNADSSSMKLIFTTISMFLTLALTPLTAQEAVAPDRALVAQQRKVAFFGFEEAANFPTPLPAPFFRVLTSVTSRPGFPRFGSVGVDEAIAFSGDWSLGFEIDGASIAVAVPTARIPIYPQSEYEVRVRVRTSGLARAGASLVVRLHDLDGREIPGTKRESIPVRTNGEWTMLSVRPPTDIQSAADLTFELHLKQDQRPDLSGKVWFDEIEVWQLPRMSLTAQPVSGVTRLPERPTLNASLNDLATGALTAVLSVYDIDGILRAQRRQPISRGRTNLALTFDDLPVGWYRGRLSLFEGETLLAREDQAIAILPKSNVATLAYGAPHFGMSFSKSFEDRSESELQFASILQPDYVSVPVWQAGIPARLNSERSRGLDQFVDTLHASGIEPVFELSGLPSDLTLQDSKRIGGNDVLDLISRGDGSVLDLLSSWMAQYGDEVSRWRVAAPARLNERQIDSALAEIDRRARKFVAAPILELDLDVLKSRPELETPSDFETELVAIGTLNDGAIGSSHGTDFSGVLLIDAATVFQSDRMRATKVARDLVEAWSRGADYLELHAPWNRTIGSTFLKGLDASGYVFQTIASRLSARGPQIPVPLGRGLNAYLLKGDTQEPMIVAWAVDGAATMELSPEFGDVQITSIDGTRAPLLEAQGTRSIELGEAPIFLTGFDQKIARFRAEASMTPDFIEASTGVHECIFSLYNPWPEAIEVRLRPMGPASFRFQPLSRRVTIQPGQHEVVPFEFIFPRTQVGGELDLRLSAEIIGSREQTAQLLVPTSVRSSRMALESSWRLSHDLGGREDGLLVTVSAYNSGRSPLLLEAFCSAVGFAPKRKAMPEILPGETATRTFYYPGAQESLSGHEIVVGLSQLDFDGYLVRRLTIDEEASSMLVTEPVFDEMD